MKIMIMTDSRGALLQGKIEVELRKQLPQLASEIDVTVKVMEGATLDNIIKKMHVKYGEMPHCDLIYIHAGVNNLTTKNGPIVQLVFDNIPDLIDTITDKVTLLKSKLHKTFRNVIMVQLVGIEIARYNRETCNGFWYYQQKVINEAMPILAHTINFINKADGLVGPWLTATIHDFVKKCPV